MLIFVEGLQQSGKTHLINTSQTIFSKHLAFRLPFEEIVKLVHPSEMAAASFSKDIALVSFAKYLASDVVFDRSFISSATFNRILNRCSDHRNTDALQSVKKLLSDVDYKIIVVDGKFDKQRERNDGFDNIDQKTAEIAMNTSLMEFEDNVIRFQNNYDTESVDRFDNLIKELIGEY